MSLKDKAVNNYNVAQYSEKKKYYDVAVSRYYYYIYQNILHYFSAKPVNSCMTGEDSHRETIKLFIDGITTDFKRENKNLLLLKNLFLIDSLRKIRNESDYKDISITDENVFKTRFKNKFDDVDRVIKDIII